MAFRMPKGSRKITAAEWRDAGGLRNSSLWRRQDERGRWHYYTTD